MLQLLYLFLYGCAIIFIYITYVYTPTAWTPLDYSGTFRFLYQLATTSAWFYFEIHVRHYRIYMSEMKWVHTHLGLSQLQLQLSGLHCHGMCAPLQCVINPYPVNYLR